MSKKWMIIAGVAALAIVVVVVVLFALPRKALTPITVTTGSTSSSPTGAGNSNTGSTTEKGTSTVTTFSPGSSTSGGGVTNSGGGSTNSGGGSTPPKGSIAVLKPFPPMPESKAAAHAATSPAASGETLAPLTNAPPSTISALKLGLIPARSQYQITMSPYGVGPSNLYGSRVVIHLDSVKPVGSAPANSRIENANLLVVVDTTHAGTVTTGGTYTGTLTFSSDGTELLPILSNVSAR